MKLTNKKKLYNVTNKMIRQKKVIKQYSFTDEKVISFPKLR